jgi:hypothetical protein
VSILGEVRTYLQLWDDCRDVIFQVADLVEREVLEEVFEVLWLSHLPRTREKDSVCVAEIDHSLGSWVQ